MFLFEESYETNALYVALSDDQSFCDILHFFKFYFKKLGEFHKFPMNMSNMGNTEILKVKLKKKMKNEKKKFEFLFSTLVEK